MLSMSMLGTSGEFILEMVLRLLLRHCRTLVMSTSDGTGVSHGFTSKTKLTMIPCTWLSACRRGQTDDVAIREPPSYLSQIVAVMKKVQTIIRRCMVSIGGTLGCTPSQYDIQATFPVQPSRRRPREHVPDQGALGVKRGARRHPGRGAGAGRLLVPPAPQRQEHVDPGPAMVERGEGSGSGQQYVDPFDSPHLDMPFYSLGLTPDPQSLPSGFGTSQMPPTPTGSWTPQQLISQASSSNKEEGQDALYRGHRVGKKTVRLTPFDWP
ncbi:hypothetical protein M9H77_16640 [Catharanthus roseus]|uniref:Uncharacterized protein n=1 Tax=Catharanthus roseus TaxID=4058 RepID=A0ACC0B2H6_CATRO|nr:hypothetical protein M9H77_16640 [Catharanthus roseus]